MVLAAGVPAVDKRAAESVNYSDEGRSQGRSLDWTAPFGSSQIPPSCYNLLVDTTSTVTLSSMVSDHNYSRPDHWDRIILS